MRLDRMTRVQVTMPLAAFADEVTVTETTPVIDPQRVSTGQTFISDFMEEAVVGTDIRYSYHLVALQAPGVSTGPAGQSGFFPLPDSFQDIRLTSHQKNLGVVTQCTKAD